MLHLFGASTYYFILNLSTIYAFTSRLPCLALPHSCISSDLSPASFLIPFFLSFFLSFSLSSPLLSSPLLLFLVAPLCCPSLLPLFVGA